MERTENDKVDTSSTAAAVTMMQEELPQYLQNMLLACGYDRLQVIAEMDASQTQPKLIMMLTKCWSI